MPPLILQSSLLPPLTNILICHGYCNIMHLYDRSTQRVASEKSNVGVNQQPLESMQISEMNQQPYACSSFRVNQHPPASPQVQPPERQLLPQLPIKRVSTYYYIITKSIIIIVNN